jgi:hypothetical protein
LYRRNSLIRNACTREALEQFHKYESTGQLPENTTLQQYRQSNGFANGKWVLKVNEETICKDIQTGDFCKAEFYSGPSGWYWKKTLKDKPSCEFFGWR